MKKTILLSYIALLIAFGLPMLAYKRAESAEETSPPPLLSPTPTPSESPVRSTPLIRPAEPAPETVSLVDGEKIQQMDMQEYLIGVVAAEMPASFHPEALKAQAVAARSYAIYTAECGKHSPGQLCRDYKCCQAWSSTDTLKEKWGADYESNMQRIRTAVEETEGEYLCYQGKAVFAAFHSSSAGATENSGQLWAQLPYLVSVESPETADSVPNYISSLSFSPLDFRDSILREFPEADFTGDEKNWIGELTRDSSGRIDTIRLGGVEIGGTKLRTLFSLRSTAFTLEYRSGNFVFTVTGYGHGVGMSQYGANVMALQGENYRDILAHYYPGTELVGA